MATMPNETAPQQAEALPISVVSPEPDERSTSEFARIAAGPGWRRLQMHANTVAPHLRVASIEGEQGTGKLTFARYLHARSPLARAEFRRRDAREWLATEADREMERGFLYLDRVDMLAIPGQALLLNVLKAIQADPAGRMALVASSQCSLRRLAAVGRLMPDLALRLTAVRFAIPPLRERREDIAPLAQSLLERICARYRHRYVTLAPAAMARLLQHNWPGNVRELESVLEAALLEMQDNMIRPGDLQIPVASKTPSEVQAVVAPESLHLDAMIHRHVRSVLSLNRGNKVRAARQLGISRSTLYRLLEQDQA